MATPNPQEPVAVDVRAGLTESRWLALTRGFCNVGATITTSPLTLLGRLQFLSRIPEQRSSDAGSVPKGRRRGAGI